MATFRDIGVSSTTTYQGAQLSQSVPSGRGQIVGVTAKGPLNYENTIRDIKEFERIFGGRTPYSKMYDHVRATLALGTAELFITRVVGAAATNGSVTLTDGASESPKDVLTVEVIDPGQQSQDYKVNITARPDSGFDLTVVDTSANRTIAVFLANESPTDLASRSYDNPMVRIKDLGAGVNPAAGSFAVSAGSDDRASVTVDDYVKALDAHKGVPGGVALAAPDLVAPVSAEKIGQHAIEREKIYLADLPYDTTLDEACAIGDTLMGKPNTKNVTVIYPSIRIPDSSQRTRTVGGSAHAMAARSVTHTTVSPAQPPAGQARAMAAPTSPVSKLDLDDINELNQHGISGIQTTGGRSYLNNWSSLSTDPTLRELAHTDAMNQIAIALRAGAERLLWRPNEGLERIRGEAAGVVDTVLQPYYAAGYLFPDKDAEGNVLNAGYGFTIEDIRTSGQNAPYSELAMTVWVKLSPIVRHVEIGITSVDPMTAI